MATRDERAAEVIEWSAVKAMAAMTAIPVPGADFAATFAVWGVMVKQLAEVYGYRLALSDATRLASELFRSVVLTSVKWFASAKAATFFCKFIPGAGTVTAGVLDAVIAGYGARKVTARLGTAAAEYFKSGRTLAPKTLAEHVRAVTADRQTVLLALRLIPFGPHLSGLADAADELTSPDA